jgi:hypothetical protein
LLSITGVERFLVVHPDLSAAVAALGPVEHPPA